MFTIQQNGKVILGDDTTHSHFTIKSACSISVLMQGKETARINDVLYVLKWKRSLFSVAKMGTQG